VESGFNNSFDYLRGKIKMESAGKTTQNDSTILLVDDEEMVLDIGVQMLKRLGYNVMKAESGTEAIGIFQKNRETIDIVILDIVMPDLSGSETVDAIKEINPNAKILLSSGYGRDSKTNEILQRCHGFIQKPFSMKELSEAVAGVVEQH
jgi:DNA-binding NtrC family response regulator